MQNVADGELLSGKERRPCIFLRQLNLVVFIEHERLALTEKQVERLRDFTSRRFQAAGTGKFERNAQAARDPDLRPRPLCRGIPLQWRHLADIVDLEIDIARLQRTAKRHLILAKILKVDEQSIHGCRKFGDSEEFSPPTNR